MQLSARNQLNGTVKRVEHGAVNSEVIIELAAGIEVVSIITKQSAEQLDESGQIGLRCYQSKRCNDRY